MPATYLTFTPETGLTELSSPEQLAVLPLNALIWIDIESEDGGPLQAVAAQLGLHELTVEDCLTPGHFPKIEDFTNYLFIVTRALKPLSELEAVWEKDELEPVPQVGTQAAEEQERYTRKVAMYLSERFVITFRRYEIAWLDALVRHVQQSPEASLALGTDALAHRVLDVLTDRFARGLTFFERIVDNMEHVAIDADANFQMAGALDLKRELLTLKQIVRDERIVITKLATDPLLRIRKQQRRYFKDIDDHLIDIFHTIEQQIDSLIGLRDAYFALANVRLNDTMKVLAVITTVAAPVNIVVGIYGMNFHWMPLLSHEYGFWIFIGTILLLTSMILVFFRRKRWI